MRVALAILLVASPAFADEPENPRIIPPLTDVELTYKSGKVRVFTTGEETELVLPRSIPEKWLGPEALKKCEEAWILTSKDLQVEQEKDDRNWWAEGA